MCMSSFHDARATPGRSRRISCAFTFAAFAIDLQQARKRGNCKMNSFGRAPKQQPDLSAATQKSERANAHAESQYHDDGDDFSNRTGKL